MLFACSPHGCGGLAQLVNYLYCKRTNEKTPMVRNSPTIGDVTTRIDQAVKKSERVVYK